MFRRPDTIPYPLYVVTVVFNPERFRTRWKLYKDCEKRVKEAGGVLFTCEVAYGDREFVLDAPEDDPMRLLQLRTNHELWVKENALNLLIQRVAAYDQNFQAVMTLDADCNFARDDWADETLHALQHYDIVQPWSEADDLTDQYEHHQRHHSFVFSWLHNEPMPDEPGYYYYYNGPTDKKVVTWHPGFAWAYRRHALEKLGGLIDIGILGSGDSHMAKSLIGRGETSIHPRISTAYRNHILRWQGYATEHIKQNIGYVPGLILHHWHGPKVKRRYRDRWKILVENKFNPLEDIKRDVQGLWQLCGNKPLLRDQLREYFQQRDEDAPHSKD